MKHRLTAILIGLVIIALGLPALGNVFWRWRPGSGRAVFDTTPDWRRVYQSNVRINGSQGRLEILNCEDALSGVMARLNHAFSPARPDAAFRHSESAGWGLIRTGDMVTRILALNFGVPAQTVVFVLTQSPGEYEQSLKPPATHLLAEAPIYPGSVAQTFLEDEEASAQLEISAAPGRPDSIWAFFDSTFEQNGYHRMQAMDVRGQADAGLAIFQKGMSFCCVRVQASPQDHESVITVLHKRLRMD